ncbi:MAG: dihydropteroate synthase, partial [Solirubrobacteraceae bacterium]
HLRDLHSLKRPLLAAVSRKDFIGALTRRAPRERLAGTLAALGATATAGAHMARIHDIAAAADFLAVHEALTGSGPLDSDLRVDHALRREPLRVQEL